MTPPSNNGSYCHPGSRWKLMTFRPDEIGKLNPIKKVRVGETSTAR